MTSGEIRETYLNYFASRGHGVVPFAPRVPQNDPATLFMESGMQPLSPYL